MHCTRGLCLVVAACSVTGTLALAQQGGGQTGSSYTVMVQPHGSNTKLTKQQKTIPQQQAPPQTWSLKPEGNLLKPSQLPSAQQPPRQPLPQPAEQPMYPVQAGGYSAGGGSYSMPQDRGMMQPAASTVVGSGSTVTTMVMPKGYKGTPKSPRGVPAEEMPPTALMPAYAAGVPGNQPVLPARGARTATTASSASSIVRPDATVPAATMARGGGVAADGFTEPPVRAGSYNSSAPLPVIDTRPISLPKKAARKKMDPGVRATRTRDLPEGYKPNPPDEALLTNEHLRWDGEYELDKLERPQLDSEGKVIPVLYDRKGKAVRPKGLKLAKLHPATISNGVLTVDGWTSKGRLNYAVQDLRYLYFSVPGVGTVVVSPENFSGAEMQDAAFDNLTLKVTAGDHEVQLVTEKPILTKNTLPAYVKIDKSYLHDRKAPVMGYGSFDSAPYLWPGAVQGKEMAGSLDAPELPKNMLPQMAGHLCDSRTGSNCDSLPASTQGGRPAWAVDDADPVTGISKKDTQQPGAEDKPASADTSQETNSSPAGNTDPTNAAPGMKIPATPPTNTVQ